MNHNLGKNMQIRTITFAAIVAILTGCSSGPHATYYFPSSTKIVDGSLNVGTFIYLPSQNDSEIKPNQIRNTTIGDALFDKNINQYFEKALFIESRFVGIKVGGSSNEVSGEITEFLMDDLGYSIDWTLEVNYIVKQQAGNECYNKVIKIEKTAGKYTHPYEDLNEIMKLNIEKVFDDASFVKCISR